MSEAMTEIESLCDRIRELEAERDILQAEHARELRNVVAALARANAAEQNAARYRWLRDGPRYIARDERYTLMAFQFWCSPAELDAAIDAARAKEQSR